MDDKLVLAGVHENIDGEHDCDIIGMLTVGHPNSLTNRELHRIKLLTGLKAPQLFEGIQEGDTDATVGLASVVLTRNGKTYQDDWLWDAPMGASLQFLIKAAEDDDELPPPSGSPVNTPTGDAETNGGVSSEPGSGESPQNDPSGTGSQP